MSSPATQVVLKSALRDAVMKASQSDDLQVAVTEWTPSDEFPAGYLPDIEGYFPAGSSFSVDSDQVTYRRNVVSFDVMANAAPELTITSTPGRRVGTSIPDEDTGAYVVGYPLPELAFSDLPDGVTLCAGEVADLSTEIHVWLCGTPAPGTGGAHTITVTATNSLGDVTSSIDMNIAETVADAEPSVTPSAEPSVTPSAEPSVEYAAGGSVLSSTGSEIAAMVGAALVMMAIGLALFLTHRRRLVDDGGEEV